MSTIANNHRHSHVKVASHASPGDVVVGRVVRAALRELATLVPPVWPLKDYVAVNPFLGMSHMRLLDAQQQMQAVRDCQLLMDTSYYRQKIKDGSLSTEALSAGLDHCRSQHPELYGDWTLESAMEQLWNAAESQPVPSQRAYWTAAEAIDLAHGSDWNSTIVAEVSRHLSAHFDEGQAAWQNPWRHLPLYLAWRQAAQTDRRFELLGVAKFRSFVAELSESPQVAIAQLMSEANVPEEHWHNWLACQLNTVAGWASYVRYRMWNTSPSTDGLEEDLAGLIAIRLAYDVALLKAVAVESSQVVLHPSVSESREADSNQTSASSAIRYWLQSSCEHSYRSSIAAKLLSRSEESIAVAATRKAVQMVFCIDVRSEVMRRHLESASAKVETFGFAGFFGLPFKHVGLGESHGTSQCPVLLQPSFAVHEELHTENVQSRGDALKQRRFLRLFRKSWKAFQHSATASFSFVESCGLSYVTKLVSRSLGLSSGPSVAFDGIAVGERSKLRPTLSHCGEGSLCESSQVDAAESILRNLGLTSNFARLVVLCGHASQTVNNPYRASLDCGACGGHSGESNARVAAALLNAEHVRSGLAARGIHVPADTLFLAGVHHTTTDEVKLLDIDQADSSYADDISQLQQWLSVASIGCRHERSLRMGTPTYAEMALRSRDWSEVRPEWGLAGNAAFIVGKRSRTEGLNLGGRTFLHSYDFNRDRTGSVLELIMTAPMVVASWINLQYYASTVDNRCFGSGTKTIHNPVGLFGIQQGNGGDLMTGLPWQSVHDGSNFQHEPLRLWVVIEAPRSMIDTVLAKHSNVANLVRNGWVSLASIEDDKLFELQADGQWQPQSKSSEISDLSLVHG